MTDEQSREGKLRVFRLLNDPNSTLYRVAHAQRANKSEPYEGGKIEEVYARVVDEHVSIAQRVIGIFRSRATRHRD